DDGATWATRTEGMFAEFMPPERRTDPAIQDPHCMVQCASDPESLWVQHHNGVFKSDDGAQSWTEVKVTPSSFGFAVAVHPADSRTAWLVPAAADSCRIPVDGKLAVARTRDSGASFELLGRGLPATGAFDLIYRHNLDIDGSGERLAMGSTTGSLW